jgi:hypothetical protein
VRSSEIAGRAHTSSNAETNEDTSSDKPKDAISHWRLLIRRSSFLFILSPMDRTRHSIGYLCENLKSWQNALVVAAKGTEHGLTMNLPRPGDIPPQHVTELQYEHDSLFWRSNWRVLVPGKVVGKKLVVEHRLVIRLPNNGFFYVEESVLPIKKSGIENDRHTEREGWAIVDPEAWTELGPFEIIARKWFGYNDDQKLRRMILYNSTANRVDNCLLCPETLNGIEFSFEPGFPLSPIPDEFWD